MKPAKFLLLGSGGLATSLRAILESACADIRLTQEPLDESEAGFEVQAALTRLKNSETDLCFIILSESSLRQPEPLFQLMREAASVPIIFVVEKSEPELLHRLIEGRQADFIAAPLQTAELLERIWPLIDASTRQAALAQRLKERYGLSRLIGESEKFLAEINSIPRVAKCDASVLISGETGTGKELCARAIHYLSPRTFKPFVPVNCGAVPVELIENELFGHKSGAFTGATTSEHGLIREADGGTLFLDEIDHLPTLAQVKLLRFLQDKEYRPLGSHKTQTADVRVIAATSIDPEEASQRGIIRQDLFYRLNVISLVLPPLRERKEDILLLAHHFLSVYATKFQKSVQGFSAEAKQRLVMYDWPGNVRELEHVVERAVVLTDNELIQGADVIQSRRKAQSPLESFSVAKTRFIAQFERRYIEDLLLAYEGNVTRAAAAARKNRRALWELIRKHRIDMQGIRSLAKNNHA
ncbi:MAG: sigma-54-dependent Fis family transcriptional regulator [Acidobacteria bacterium]|nr:sigma-54-dependent Fis family transcriptional regulator [Acidobacteriota bacterium]